MARGSVLIGIAIGAGALLLVPGVAAAVARAGRPLLRTAVRQGAGVAEAAGRAFGDLYEHVEDVVAEVRADMAAADGADPEAEAEAPGAPAPAGP